MKSKDIIIGESYKVGYYGRGKILATSVERANWSGNIRKDGVDVFMEEGYCQGEHKTVSSRDISQLWSEYKAAMDTAEMRRKIDGQDRERISDQAAGLADQLRQSGVEVANSSLGYRSAHGLTDYNGVLTLTEEAMADLSRLLKGLGKVEAEETSGALADLLS